MHASQRAARPSRILVAVLLLPLIAVSWPRQPASSAAAPTAGLPGAVAPHAAAVQVAPPESWLITWDASTSGSGAKDGRRVSRQTHVTASIVVNYYADGTSDYYVNEYTGTSLVEYSEEFGCYGGGRYRYHERREVTDPAKYSGNGPIPQGPGGVMPYKPYPWTPTAWSMNLIILYPGNTPEAPGKLPVYHTRDITYCGGDGDSYRDTYDGTDHLDNLTSKVRSPFNGDANGLFLYTVDTQIQYTEFGVTYPLTIKEHLRVERLTGLDLRVREIEVTQGLQLHNTIPLVQGRRTVARAYIDIGINPGPIANVTARLLGYDGATLLGEVQPFNPAGWIIARRSPDWLKLEDTLNFELPRSWTVRPSLRLEIEVNHTREVGEVAYTNNISSAQLPLRDCKPVTIGYLPIRYAPPGATPANPGADIAAGQEFLRKVYPVADDELLYKPWPGMTWSRPIDGADVDESVRNGDILLSRLLALLIFNTGPAVDRLVGWLPGHASLDLYGLADNIPGHVAWVSQYKNPNVWRNVFAHEAGHTHGVTHDGLTTGGYRWFDVYERSIKPPLASGDLLDFLVTDVQAEDAHWVSPATYNFLYNQYCSGAAAAAANATADVASAAVDALASAADLLVVTGQATATDTAAGQLDPLFRSGGTALIPPDGAEYYVILKGGTTELGKYGFDVNVEVAAPTPITPTVGAFALAVPYPVGLTRVDLTDRDGRVLNSRTASTNPPAVTVHWPNDSGLVLSGVQTIRWTATDPDGDALTYSVLYSVDNGVTWQGLAAGITAASYEADFDSIPGSSAALVRVLASDGFHTAADVSDQPFAVPAKPPVPVIISPPAGARFTAGETVHLQGYAVDLEDGMVAPSGLSWSSDLGGALGAGSTLEVTLQEGTHTITLAAAGGTAAATTTVIVQARGTSLRGHRVYLPLLFR
jgi:hypothetical protein